MLLGGNTYSPRHNMPSYYDHVNFLTKIGLLMGKMINQKKIRETFRQILDIYTHMHLLVHLRRGQNCKNGNNSITAFNPKQIVHRIVSDYLFVPRIPTLLRIAQTHRQVFPANLFTVFCKARPDITCLINFGKLQWTKLQSAERGYARALIRARDASDDNVRRE